MVLQLNRLKTLLSEKSHANPVPHSPCTVSVASMRNHLYRFLSWSFRGFSMQKLVEENVVSYIVVFRRTPLCALPCPLLVHGHLPRWLLTPSMSHCEGVVNRSLCFLYLCRFQSFLNTDAEAMKHVFCFLYSDS